MNAWGCILIFFVYLECDLIMMLLERERPDLILLVLMLFYLGK